MKNGLQALPVGSTILLSGGATSTSNSEKQLMHLSHSFGTARKSILPLWSHTVQAQHSAPFFPPLSPNFLNISGFFLGI